MRKAAVIMNETHAMFPEQRECLRRMFGTYINIISLPEEGATYDQMEELMIDMVRQEDTDIVFISPVPYMLMRLAKMQGAGELGERNVYMFHRDIRIKAFLKNRREGEQTPPWRLLKA